MNAHLEIMSHPAYPLDPIFTSRAAAESTDQLITNY
jgi:hypothetical protein